MPPSADTWQRVKELFDAALDLTPDERAALLDRACAGDEALRAEVESLLESDEQTSSFIDDTAFGASRPRPDASDDSAAFVGRHFGAYRVIRELGRGGLGIVYLAARADAQFQKEVAIKVVKRGLDTDEIVQRFRAERQILAHLDHPNIARLIDAGSTEEGLPYFVMEYIDGQPIGEYCATLGTTERLHLFRLVCSAVTYAHQRLVIHRDIKPSNILVTREGVPKLLDFGIAKVLHSDDPLAAQTLTGVRVMTPEYASPEQVRGETISTATDVYSLGVLLYELLTRQRPYRFTTRTTAEIERAITEQTPAPPSTVASESHRQQLRGDLDNIVLMAMRKEPERRYASVDRLADDIRRHLEGLPVLAHRDTLRYRTQKYIQRNKIAVAAAAVVFLTLVAGIIVTAVQAQRVVQERNRARKEAAKASQINAFLEDVLAFSDPTWRSSNPNLTRDPSVADALKIAGERAESQLADQPAVLAAVQHTLGRTYAGQGKLDLAERLLRSALETRLRVLGPEDQDTAQSMTSLGEVFLWRADNAEAERWTRKALAIYRQAQKNGEADAKGMVIALNNLGLAVSTGKKDHIEAEALYREAAKLGAGFTGMDRAALANVYNNLALLRFDQGDVGGALADMEKSIEEQKRLPGDTRLDLGTKLANLGLFLTKKGDYAQAAEYYRQALDAQIATVGEVHQRTAQIRARYAETVREQGDYPRALEEIQRAIAVQERLLPADHLHFANTWQILGETLTRMGRLAEGEDYLRRALERGSPKWAKDDRFLTEAQRALAENLQAQERFAEAKPLLQAAYEGTKERVGPDHPDTARAAERLRNLEQARTAAAVE